MSLTFLLLLALHYTQVNSHWWLSSQVFAISSRVGCKNIGGLVREQKELCTKYPSLMSVVGEGAERGLAECQHQFQTSKWNCSDVDHRQKRLLGLLTSKGNKESAFFQAITSAGITYQITQACSEGVHFESCHCVSATNPHPDFKWDNCNDNIRFGVEFAKRFLDAREIGNDARVQMNKQNNLAGRMAVKTQMREECVCHGLSGACNMRTCRFALPRFSSVGDTLHQQYHGAIYATLDQKHNRLVAVHPDVKQHTPSNLVYLEGSPNYCIRDRKQGTLGVAGRFCNKTSNGSDGCRIMCCDGGIHTKKVIVKTDCNCKFNWCCKLNCQTCEKEVKHHFCHGEKKKKKKRKREKNKIKTND